MQFKVGDHVRWNDPAIDEYPEEERQDILGREFVVQSISDEVALILEVGSPVGWEQEVPPRELELIT